MLDDGKLTTNEGKSLKDLGGSLDSDASIYPIAVVVNWGDAAIAPASVTGTGLADKYVLLKTYVELALP